MYPFEEIRASYLTPCERPSFVVLFLLLLSHPNVPFDGFIKLLPFRFPVIVIWFSAVCIIIQLFVWVIGIHGVVINIGSLAILPNIYCFEWCVPR